MYNLEPRFERRVSALCASHKVFWLRIGNRMVADCLRDETNKTLVKLAKAVAADHGTPTEDLVCQRAHLWMDEGKIDERTALAVAESFSELDPELDLDQTIQELVEPVRRHWMQSIAQKVVEKYKNQSKFYDLVDEMAACDNLGAPMADIEVKASELGEDTDLLLDCSNIAIQMPTGIAEVDAEFNGGTPLGTLLTYLMDSKAGKSIQLCFGGSVAAMQGENVGYLSLELPKPELHRRILAAIVGCPINDLHNESYRRDALHIWRTMREKGQIGKIVIETFPQLSLDEKQVVAWFDRQEKEHNCRIRYRVVDYGDLIASSKREDRESEYGRGKTVWTALYNMANRENEANWVITATQSKRPDTKPGQIIQMLTRKDVADSVHKYRLSDFFITGTPQPDMKAEQGYLWYIDADRYFGKTGTVVGPVPHFRHMSRMGDISYLGK